MYHIFSIHCFNWNLLVLYLDIVNGTTIKYGCANVAVVFWLKNPFRIYSEVMQLDHVVVVVLV